tara:strand:- start:14061 stop:14879 length:819 start_codon:yes stop_codon:yes gene_type:complete
MRLEFRVISIEKRDPALIAAMDEAILEECEAGRSPPTLVYHNWEKSISIARVQALTDIDLDKCLSDNFKVVRMITGGKAVVHFPDTEFSYSLFVPKEFGKINITQTYETYCSRISKTLKSFGLPNVVVDNNDIFVGGKKIGGNAQRVRRNFSMQQGVILYDCPNADTMLNFMNAELYPKSASEELAALLTGFTQHSDASQKELIGRLTENITASSYSIGELSEKEKERIEELLPSYETLESPSATVVSGLCWLPAPVYIENKKRRQEAIANA